MSNDINQDVAKELVAQTAGKTYDDIAHPTAHATGQIISFIPRTIKVWLGKWEKWILNGEYAIKETEILLAEKLKHVPEEKIVEPEPYVAVPALQQLSYSLDSEELRELYANLLASSMNADTKGDVHPAFVDIIKQLAPDEAKLLRYFSEQKAIPAVEVRKRSETGTGFRILAKLNFTIPDGLLDVPQNYLVYVDNLIRLQLVEIPADTHYSNESLYKSLENPIIYLGAPTERLVFERKIVKITPFGKLFVKTCQPKQEGK